MGLAVTGRVPARVALRSNKILKATINGGERSDVALVDVSVTTEPYAGARALWRSEHLREVIGLSAIAGLLRPVGRHEPLGARAQLQSPAVASIVLRVPLAPGLIRSVGVRHYDTLAASETIRLRPDAGMISLDGEREMYVRPGDRAEITLVRNAFDTLDVGAIMRYAAEHDLFRKERLREDR